jgi:hypothetical protein
MKVRENMKNVKEEIEKTKLNEIRKNSTFANIQFNSKIPEE